MEKRKPAALRKGDTIGVITPASPMLVDRLEKGLDYLQKKGFRVLLGEHVYDSRGYLAGWDRDRVNDLHAMFANPEVRAVFSSRGGYGTPRILDLVDYDLIARNPKIFLGYSDLTAIQLAIWKHTGVVTYSGPMVAVEMGLGIDPFTEEFLWKTIGPEEDGELFPEAGTALQVLRPGKARGTLLGGCLSLITSLLGTPHFPDFSGAILILEDVGEEPYRIDRYLAQLRSVGVFEQVAGVILGEFLDCVPSGETPSLSIEEIISDYFGQLPVPVVTGFPYGHGPKKFTVPVGVEVELDADGRRVRLLEPPVVRDTA